MSVCRQTGIAVDHRVALFVSLSMFPLEYSLFMKPRPSGQNSLLVTKDRFADNSCGQKEAGKKNSCSLRMKISFLTLFKKRVMNVLR